MTKLHEELISHSPLLWVW